MVEIDRLRALRFQVIGQECRVAVLVIGVVVDVLGHVAIENLKGSGVERVPPSDS